MCVNYFYIYKNKLMSSDNFRIYYNQENTNSGNTNSGFRIYYTQENTNSGNTNSGFRIYDTEEYNDEIIVLSDIATYITGDQIWLLNGNTTILYYQTLIVPINEQLLTNSFTLTNNGTINLLGTIRNSDTFEYDIYNCVTINNGIINIFSSGTISANFNTTNIFTNNSIVNNNGGNIISQEDSVIINTTDSVINNTGNIITNISYTINYGIINNTMGGLIVINNYGFTLWFNYGTIYNTGGIIINTNSLSIFTNNGIVYNNNGGEIDNTIGTFVNDSGIIHNPLTDNGCGIGIISVPITTGIVDESC